MQEGMRDFYMPGEWHTHSCCWMAWPTHQQTWECIGFSRARQAFANVCRAIASFEPVNMLVNPEDVDEARTLLLEESPCAFPIKLIECPISDSWARDTGPSFLINTKVPSELAGVHWKFNAWGFNYENFALDEQMGLKILEECNAIVFAPPIVMEGGSFHVDGEGTLLTTKECLLHPNRNPDLTQEQIEGFLRGYLNVSTIIWLNQGLVGDETNGHVDEIACFVSPGHVLALITNDESDENYERLQENLEILRNSTDARGRKLVVHTVEQPRAFYIGEERLTLSYTNFYLANNGIVMGKFMDDEHDEAALELFKKLYPGHEIIQIDALDVFAGGGGIHCITQQQPALTN